MTYKSTNQFNIDEVVDTSDSEIMTAFKTSVYWILFKKYIQTELDKIEKVGWEINQELDTKLVSKMELLRYQRAFVKGLLDLPDKLIAMDVTKELQEQQKVNEIELKKLM